MYGRLLGFAFTLPFALLACSENGFVKADETQVGDGKINVEPLELDFGQLAAGEQAIQTFTISNIGVGDLTVTNLQLEGASYTVLTDLSNFVLPAGASETVDVAFAPLGADSQIGSVTVLSTDNQHDAVEVDLVGHGAVPDLDISPNPYDFGTVFIGCGETQELRLENIGSDDLEITDIDFDSDDNAMELIDENDLPLTLAPGQATTVAVSFYAESVSTSRGELTVRSNDPAGDEVAVQVGEGAWAERGEDTFDIPENPPVDILFAVDQSCSMDAHAANLASNFGQLASALSAVTNNWRVGVATLQSGCFNNGIITPSTPQAKFTEAVRMGADEVADTEKLFALTNTALSKTTGSGCNAGFLRPSALLHVVFVTDEWEQSGISASSWVANAGSYKSSDSLLKASGIVCPDSGCSWAGADGFAGNYLTAIATTGGERLDISSTNWGSTASRLAEASLDGIYNFELSEDPVESTIRVYVNGVEVTSGWWYDPSANEVRFTELSGGTVVVKYGVEAECN